MSAVARVETRRSRVWRRVPMDVAIDVWSRGLKHYSRAAHGANAAVSRSLSAVARG